MSYKNRAIDILTSDQDWHDLCIIIAKLNPSALCKAVEYNSKTVRETVSLILEERKVEVKSLYEKEGRAAAIKYYRNQTGKDLKTSKSEVEKMMCQYD